MPRLVHLGFLKQFDQLSALLGSTIPGRVDALRHLELPGQFGPQERR